MGNRRGKKLEEQDEMEALEVNQLLMSAVEAYDDQSVRRILEEQAHAWLGCPLSFSEDPRKNPALAAILHPLGSSCADAFDWFFGDLRNWRIGEWLPIHWAAGSKLASAMQWCLRGSGRGMGPGGPLMELDKEHSTSGVPRSSAFSAPRRSALGVCALTGDAEWVAKAIEMAQAEGANLSEMIRRDERGNVCAIGLALFEAGQAAMDGDRQRVAGLKACARLLFKKGFSPDATSMAASRIVAAGTWAASDGANRSKIVPIIGLAVDLANRRDKLSRGAFARAGSALDSQWASDLERCGLCDGPEENFGLAASHELKFQFLRESSTAKLLGLGRPDPAGAQALARMSESSIERLGERISTSMAMSGVPRQSWPLKGFELDVLEMLASRSSTPSAKALREKIVLALHASEAPAASSKASPRL